MQLAAISHITMPRAYISDLVEYVGRVTSNSGANQRVVPLRESLETVDLEEVVVLTAASPKSASLTSMCFVSSTLALLRSRWMTFLMHVLKASCYLMSKPNRGGPVISKCALLDGTREAAVLGEVHHKVDVAIDFTLLIELDYMAVAKPLKDRNLSLDGSLGELVLRKMKHLGSAECSGPMSIENGTVCSRTDRCSKRKF